jgi:hypothetical protein
VFLHLIWIVPLVLIIAFLLSPRFRGDIAESRTRRILAAGLEKSRYTILNDVELPAGGGTVHVDHIVVSRSGVFVIESQYASGMVSGSEFQDRWKQQHWGRARRIENPMHQNAVQAETLGRLLGMPQTKIHRIVVLSGHKGLRTKAPDHLVPAEQLIRYIRKKGTYVLEPEQADRALKAIEQARVKPAGGVRIRRWNLLNALLVFVLLTGIWLAFGEDIRKVQETWSERREQRESPDLFHPDGSRKAEQEIWEDSLICAWSEDTGRCACYEPSGQKANLEQSRCRTLAERGSILKQ